MLDERRANTEQNTRSQEGMRCAKAPVGVTWVTFWIGQPRSSRAALGHLGEDLEEWKASKGASGERGVSISGRAKSRCRGLQQELL